MHLVEEKIRVTAVDEDDELVLDFCRLAGGAVDELFEVDILLKIERSRGGKNFQKWPQKVTGSP
jgi:hypothetical protein